MSDDRDADRPLQAVAHLESAEMAEILRLLESGEIEPERARARLMSVYHRSLGGTVRGLSETHPDVARRLLEGVLGDLQRVADELSETAPATATAPPKRNWPTPNKPPPSLAGKASAVLERERAVVSKLASANRQLKLSELYRLVAGSEDRLTMPAFTANVRRLVEEGVISKEVKGAYAAVPASQQYLEAIDEELAARAERRADET